MTKTERNIVIETVVEAERVMNFYYEKCKNEGYSEENYQSYLIALEGYKAVRDLSDLLGISPNEQMRMGG